MIVKGQARLKDDQNSKSRWGRGGDTERKRKNKKKRKNQLANTVQYTFVPSTQFVCFFFTPTHEVSQFSRGDAS